MTIFDQIAQARTDREDDSGSMRVKDDLRSSLNLALKHCPLSRHLVAGQMSHLLQEEISKSMIDAWTCESKSEEPGRHIPAEYIPAFCVATGCNQPLEILNKRVGLFAMEGPDAIRSEIQRLREQSRELQSEIRRREQLLGLFQGEAARK